LGFICILVLVICDFIDACGMASVFIPDQGQLQLKIDYQYNEGRDLSPPANHRDYCYRRG
jgi:hypothetical protein